jgi:hypothetical protein
MDVLIDDLLEARSAHQRRDWRTSYAAFVRIDGMGPMTLDDLDAYASVAWRLGHAAEAVRLAERVYTRLARTDPAGAARKAAELGLEWRVRGHDAVARAWLDRARVLVVGAPSGGAHGYVAYLDAITALAVGDHGTAVEAAEVVYGNAVETDEAALSVLGDVVSGVAALLDSRTMEGCRLLDAALTPVVDDRVPIEWAADSYRVALTLGRRFADAAHLAAWTQAMRRWCEEVALGQDMVVGPFR